MSVQVTVMVLMVLAAFITAIVAAMGKCPLWVSVILLCIIELIRVVPGGR